MKMNKLVVMAAVALSAIALQAAAVSWKVTNASYKGATVYAIAGTSAEITALFESGNSADWSAAVNGAPSATLNNKGIANGSLGGVGDSVVFAIINGEIAEGTAYLLTGDVSTSGYTYEGAAAPPGTLQVAASAFSKTGVFTASTTPVDPPGPGDNGPEPTSGLLMLVGGAMLALRRKQK